MRTTTPPPGGGSGKLRIGDNWNAIRIIALSQGNPLKAVAEFVENSIDAKARHITIIRGKDKGLPYIRIICRLFAKELVLKNFPGVDPAEILERLIELSLYTEENLRLGEAVGRGRHGRGFGFCQGGFSRMLRAWRRQQRLR